MSNCRTKQNVILSDMKAGEQYIAFCEAFTELDPTPMSSYDLRIEMRLGGEDGVILAAWEKGDPEITYDDTEGLTTLTVSSSETLSIVNDPLYDGVAYIDFLFTKVGADGWRTDPIQINPIKGITQLGVTP